MLVDCKAECVFRVPRSALRLLLYSWCAPCKALAPRLEKAVKDANGALKLAVLDVDESPEVARKVLYLSRFSNFRALT